MRDFPRGKQKLAQIRIKYGKHEKMDIMVPFLDDRSANIPDALTPEIITNGFEMILSGASGYKKKIDEDIEKSGNEFLNSDFHKFMHKVWNGNKEN